MKKSLKKHREILRRKKINNKELLRTKSAIRKFERYLDRKYTGSDTRILYKCEECKRKYITVLGNFNMCSESTFIKDMRFIDYYYEIECPYCSHMNRKYLE